MHQLDLYMAEKRIAWADLQKIEHFLRNQVCKQLKGVQKKECKHWVALLNVDQLKERQLLSLDQCEEECKLEVDFVKQRNEFPLLCYSCKYVCFC